MSSRPEDPPPVAGVLALLTGQDRLYAVWLEEHDAREVRAHWAALDGDGAPRWTAELPFVPDHVGLLGGERPVFVVGDRAGTRVCRGEELACVTLSPLAGASVAFGRDEVLLDFGSGLVVWSEERGTRLVDLGGTPALVRDSPEQPRAGPCGDGWVIAERRGAVWLDRRGVTVGRGVSSALLLVEDERTYSLERLDERSAAQDCGPDAGCYGVLDLCSGASFVLAGPRWLPFRQLFATLLAAGGIAATWEAGDVSSDTRGVAYDFAGRGEVLHWHRFSDASPDAPPHVRAATFDAGGRLIWLVIEDGHLRVEVLASVPP